MTYLKIGQIGGYVPLMSYNVMFGRRYMTKLCTLLIYGVLQVIVEMLSCRLCTLTTLLRRRGVATKPPSK